jgi:[CysO sulfur-carrier protein]-S-L-cysteine hydrolase
MRIARSLLDEIVAQAREEAPNECCGIVGSRDGQAVTLFKARNARASPLAYEVDGADLQRIYDEIDQNGLQVGVIYHSHTRSDPLPSQTDINLARLGDSDQPAFPGTLYLIVGVKDPDDDLRMWSIVGNDVQQVELEVTD